jgi:hypothetical protein
MFKVTTTQVSDKVGKPRADFPLFPRARGYRAKKTRGRMVYFVRAAEEPKGKAALARGARAGGQEGAPHLHGCSLIRCDSGDGHPLRQAGIETGPRVTKPCIDNGTRASETSPAFWPRALDVFHNQLRNQRILRRERWS